MPEGLDVEATILFPHDVLNPGKRIFTLHETEDQLVDFLGIYLEKEHRQRGTQDILNFSKSPSCSQE
jgi:hypothetical protein